MPDPSSSLWTLEVFPTIVVAMPWEHVSASQLDTYLSCQRKWWLDKIGSEPAVGSSASQELGTAVHACIENFLLGNGELDHPLLMVNTFVRQVKAMQNVELLIEHEFVLDDGVKVRKGFIDLVIVDRERKVIEIWDHKTTKSWRYAKTADELRVNPQGQFYVLAVYEQFGAEYSYFFGHHQILTVEALPERTVKVEFTPAMIGAARGAISIAISEMKQLARLDDGRDVIPNTTQCWKYGGCPYRSQCQGGLPMPSLTSIPVNTNSRPKRIYLDCLPLKGNPVESFADWTAGLEAAFKAEVGKDSIQVKYAEGTIAIAIKARDTLVAPENLYIRSSDAAGMKYFDLVEAEVSEVIQGIR